MKEVIFKMDLKFKDITKANRISLMKTNMFKWYVFFTIVFFFALLFIELFFKENIGNVPILEVMFLVLILLIFLPFSIIKIWSRNQYRKYCVEDDITHIVNNNGYGMKSEGGEVFIYWNKFKAIIEEHEYIFLNITKKPGFLLYKPAIEEDKIMEIKNILQNSSVPLIKLSNIS